MTMIATWDLDSTLADTRHRADFIDPDNREATDWVQYGKLGDADTPTGLAAVFQALEKAGWLNIIVTSRPEECRSTTRKWLDKHNLHPVQLHMKPAASIESSSQWKLSVLKSISKSFGERVTVHYDDWWSTNQLLEAHGFNTVTVRVYDPQEVALNF